MRQYLEGTALRAALGPEGQFQRGPWPKLLYEAGGPGHVTVDGNLITARWPGDAHTWAHAFLDLLRSTSPAQGLAGAVQGQ